MTWGRKGDPSTQKMYVIEKEKPQLGLLTGKSSSKKAIMLVKGEETRPL